MNRLIVLVQFVFFFSILLLLNVLLFFQLLRKVDFMNLIELTYCSLKFMTCTLILLREAP